MFSDGNDGKVFDRQEKLDVLPRIIAKLRALGAVISAIDLMSIKSHQEFSSRGPKTRLDSRDVKNGSVLTRRLRASRSGLQV